MIYLNSLTFRVWKSDSEINALKFFWQKLKCGLEEEKKIIEKHSRLSAKKGTGDFEERTQKEKDMTITVRAE